MTEQQERGVSTEERERSRLYWFFFHLRKRTNMASDDCTLTINGKPHRARLGDTLLDAKRDMQTRARGLANRAFGALWTRPQDSSPNRLALAPPVPGSFSAQWAREMGGSHRPFPSHR